MLALGLCLLTASVFNIAVIKGVGYASRAAYQRTLPGAEYKRRGVIADRNMIPFTEPFADGDLRYKGTSIANHIIGYVNSDGEGMCGAEKAFDDILSSCSHTATSLFDARGNAIENFKIVKDHNDGVKNIKLTLDYHIQKICENVLDNSAITGAAVVMDVESFDVLAMASRPDYLKSEISTYVSAGGTELLNRATASYNPGSIFKIVTTAAALEEKIADHSFLSYCGGGMQIDKLMFKCHNRSGHGLLNLEEGFYKSCNCVFYDIGTALGSERICDYASLFGMGDYVTSGIIEESRGNIPQYISSARAEAANLCIGQGELMITPLQAAVMVCTVASGGIKKSVNIADSVYLENGEKVTDLRTFSEERIISEETSQRIADMMLKVTELGTGTNAKSEKVAIAGKTGSAETGWQTDNGYMVQGWFAGFFPYDNPRYALVVLTENGRGGNTSCAPVFKEIAEQIMELKNH